MNNNIKTIVELIEENSFNTRRCISDYMILLLYDLNVDGGLICMCEDAFNSEYARIDMEEAEERRERFE